MNEEETISSDAQKSTDAMKSTLGSDTRHKPAEETEVVSPVCDTTEASVVVDDDMFVLLDDSEGPGLLSSCPGEDLQTCELDELPEMSVELVDDLPEVEDVEDITSLVEGAKRKSGGKKRSWRNDITDRVKEVRELAVEHWRPGVAAAALLIALFLGFSSFWSGVGSTVTAADELSKTAIAAGQFEEWVLKTLDQHMVGTGTEK